MSAAAFVLVGCMGGQAGTASSTSVAKPPGEAAPSAKALAGTSPSSDPPSAGSPGSESPQGEDTAQRNASPEERLAERAAETRFARLTHRQYQNTVVDLLRLREPPELVFAPDARNGFAFDTSSALLVDPRVGPQYRATAEALATAVTSDDTALAAVLPCTETTSECRDEFLRSFGERAFRRPLTASDLDSFRALFDSAATEAQTPAATANAAASSHDQTAPFRAGVRLTLEAMLQTPEFLYQQARVAPRLDSRLADVASHTPAGAATAKAAAIATATETATPKSERLPLDDFSLASRLSYFLYDSMPDEALLAAARAGKLHTAEQIETHTRRLLRGARVLPKLIAFHEQAWHFERFARISPDPASYPQVPGAFVDRVRKATRLFVRDVLQSGGGLEELLTAPYAYVDAGLAPLYDVPPPAPGRFARVTFPDERRRGLLMQAGFLASNAYSIKTDPIHRGLFVVRNLLCRAMPNPPPGATETPPPPTEEPIITTRDEVALVTGQSYCPTCHAEINAPGYAFEGFDAVGALRKQDNGAVVDTTARMVLDGEWVSFSGAEDLVLLLAQSREAHRCYARRWMEYAYGRPLAQSDATALARLSRSSLPLADLIVGVTTSPAFSSLQATTAIDQAHVASPATDSAASVTTHGADSDSSVAVGPAPTSEQP